MQTQLNGGDVLIEVLRRHGVDNVFCSPGSEWPSVWEGLARLHAQGEARPGYINCRHEGLAVAAASGYTRVTGRPQAVLLHTNVGILNAALYVRAALHEHIPMLICAGEGIAFGEDPEAHDPGRHWLVQLADVDHPAALVAPYVKWHGEVKSPYGLAATIEQALQIAASAPQGPVALSIPLEMLLSPVPSSNLEQHHACPIVTPTASDEVLEQVAQALLEAKDPVILTEYAGQESGALEGLTRLAEVLGCPVMEPAGRGFMNFPTTHPLYLRPDPEAVAGADVALLAGATAPWYPISRQPAHARIIALDSYFPKSCLPYLGYGAHLAIPTPVAPALKRLVRILEQDKRATPSLERRARWERLHQQQRAALDKQAEADAQKAPISPRWLCHTLNTVLPQNSIVFQEVTVHRWLVQNYIERTQPGTFFGRIAGGLGVSLCNSLGTKLGAPGAVSVALIGDGAFHYNPVVACFGMAQEYRLPILVVLFDNQSYAAMKRGTRESFPGGWSERTETFYGADILPRPDYGALASAYGGYGVSVERPEQLEGALRQALDQVQRGRLALVDVVLSE
ncbi:MAG: hypothetical protein HYY01_11840 [Chloroflexi bacterium]|nr:hypothetical protein [Chloroflexota bacterium]